MDASYDKPTKTLTLVLDDQEDRQFTRVRQLLGIRSVSAQLETWLFALTRELASKDLDTIKARLDRANAAELDAIKATLGIG